MSGVSLACCTLIFNYILEATIHKLNRKALNRKTDVINISSPSKVIVSTLLKFKSHTILIELF